jgi:hypothetical protein
VTELVAAFSPSAYLTDTQLSRLKRIPTIRKGMHELDSGVICVDAFALRGRKRAEVGVCSGYV